ncbi:uncharacterized protein LOC117319254 [Pecten maximus]|uniref:uncharacterized protein LOC117319254 n=1 Tax=Pecten maximus TaxID=6579 RepID=UPI001457ECAD|nr:uncharacterized protein LOC117319254 [Pecten maximus]
MTLLTPCLVLQMTRFKKLAPGADQFSIQSPTYGGGVMELEAVAQSLWSSSVAQRTKAAYETGFRTYLNFLLMQGIVAVILPQQAPPVTEQLLVLFVAYCYQVLKLSYTTIKLYMCGIKYMCMQFSNCPEFFYKSQVSPRLTVVLNGVKKVQGCTTKTRLPITADILAQLCAKWKQGFLGEFTDLLMETVCTIAFFGFLRCGEFTCTQKFDPRVNLCIGDVCIKDDHIEVHLKSSKTDPFRKGVNVCLFKNKESICPFDSISRYLSVRNVCNCSST